MTCEQPQTISLSVFLMPLNLVLYCRYIGIRGSTETITCLRGKCVQYLYDNYGNQINAIHLAPNSNIVAMSVEVGQWHKLESLESGTVILECKDGKYEPLADEDVFKKGLIFK